MNAFLKFLRKIFGVDSSVDQIVSPLSRIVRDLEEHAKIQVEKGAAEVRRADELQARAKARSAEASRAERAAASVKNLMEPAV